MEIKITELSDKELEVSKKLYDLYMALDTLTAKERRNVYERWVQLKLILPENINFWEREFERVSKPL